VLELDYRATGETFRVEVWNPTLPTPAFVPRGTTLTATTSTAWSYTLTAAEFNGGVPRIRFVDLNAGNTVAGSLALDYVRLVTT
jgi:hypothetical protein